MERQIVSVMQTDVLTVGVDDLIENVESTLDENHLTCVPVVDAGGHCFGVISGPDLMHFHLQHKNSLSHHAWEVCTHKVITVEPSTSIKVVAELMLENKVHHVVISHDDIIEGIVSSFDIVGEYVLH